jgi:hypothetical protein
VDQNGLITKEEVKELLNAAAILFYVEARGREPVAEEYEEQVEMGLK